MPKQLRYARTSLLIVAAITCVSLIIVVLPFSQAAVASAAPSADDVATGLIRLELGPEALTAAGLSSGDTTELVQRAYSHLLENQDAVELADLTGVEAPRRVPRRRSRGDRMGCPAGRAGQRADLRQARRDPGRCGPNAPRAAPRRSRRQHGQGEHRHQSRARRGGVECGRWIPMTELHVRRLVSIAGVDRGGRSRGSIGSAG